MMPNTGPPPNLSRSQPAKIAPSPKSGPPPAAPTTSARPSEVPSEIVPRRKLQEWLNQICQNQTLDTDVDELLVEMADDFIDSVTLAAIELAKHRGSSTLEPKDIKLHLERNWDLKIPGFPSMKATSKRLAPEEDSARQSRAKRVLATPGAVVVNRKKAPPTQSS